jgi:hypothetical protein
MSRELIEMSLENLITLFTHLGRVWELKHQNDGANFIELMTSGFVDLGDPSPIPWLANGSVPMSIFACSIPQVNARNRA